MQKVKAAREKNKPLLSIISKSILSIGCFF
jgi:hypothetical protein